MAETGKEEKMEVDGNEDMINMTMEQWLNDCRARMTDLLMELCTFNARQFTTERRAFHDASFKRFLDIPIEMFAIMCAVFCGRIVIIGIRKRMYGRSLVMGIMAIFFVVYGFSVV